MAVTTASTRRAKPQRTMTRIVDARTSRTPSPLALGPDASPASALGILSKPRDPCDSWDVDAGSEEEVRPGFVTGGATVAGVYLKETWTTS
jgi:hypothetical protein